MSKLVSLMSLVLTAGLVCGTGQVIAESKTSVDRMAGPINGPWRRLFLDAMVVEESQGLERVFHAAKKHEQNPVLIADLPWEKTGRYPGPYLYGSVMSDQGKLRMWYRCYTPQEIFCYAESEDGFHWTKPELGLYEHNGSTSNNIFLGPKSDLSVPADLKDPLSRFHTAMVFKQPGDVPADQRYLLFGYMLRPSRHRVAFSADGLRWNFATETARKGLIPGGDATTYGYDPYSQRYIAMRKTGSSGLAGHRGGRGRAVGISWSKPGNVLDWTTPVSGPVLVPDDLDPDATQFYNGPVFAYQGMYISQLWVFHARWFKEGPYTDQKMAEAEKGSPVTTDVQLAWSWDLINWTRTPERKPFIALGDREQNEFDCGSIHTAVAPVVVGDELFFYYGGARGRYLNPRHHSIGLAKLRLDGFCSLQADNEEGWFISRRESLKQPVVTINARTGPRGSVVAEILDRHNEVLPGFSREECIPFSGDAVAHELKWQTKSLPPDLMEGDKKIRFFLKDADLYSYLPH